MTRLYATFVLPAPSGCNLKCPFCIVAKRKEADESSLVPHDYIEFFRDLLIHYPINRMSLQGYEPLLPESWPLSKQLLKLAARFFCQSSLVTNGTYLARHAREVAIWTDTVTVSLDSADPSTHDKVRGVQGAFAETVAGIRRFRDVFHGNLCINTVLFPHREEYLAGMVELLSELGIREWIISPLFRINGTSPDYKFVQDTIAAEAEKGRERGIRVQFADETRRAENIGDLYEKLLVHTLARGDAIFRLSPDGSCSIGKEIIETTTNIAKWNRVTPPSAFMADLLTNHGHKTRQRTRVGKAVAHILGRR